MNTTIIENETRDRAIVSLTPPPLPDKHFLFDMFSGNDELQQDHQKNDNQSTTHKLCVFDEPIQDIQSAAPKKFEPVLGKERAIKILKAFGSQQKPLKEFHQHPFKTPTREGNKIKKEKKSLTPLEKAKETISQIEELKKFKDRTIPTYFGENVIIHHIKVAPPLIDTKLDNNKLEIVDKVTSEPLNRKPIVDSLEALKVYNNLDTDKHSEEELISDKDENIWDETNNIDEESIRHSKKLPVVSDLDLNLKTKRVKDKRRKRSSLDSKSSGKKGKHQNKDHKKRKSRDSPSRRLSKTSNEKRPKKGQERDVEFSALNAGASDIHSKDYRFEQFTKTLPVIKYSVNPIYYRQPLTNGFIAKNSTNKRSNRSSSRSKSEKDRRKRSTEPFKEKIKTKECLRSTSKWEISKSIRKRRRNDEKTSTDPKILKISEENVTNPEKNSLDTKGYVSNFEDNWDDDIAERSMENFIALDTIPLQLNVPKQDRSILYINDCIINPADNETTPRMTGSDSTVATPVFSSNYCDITEVCERSETDELHKALLNKVRSNSASKLNSDNELKKYISKISPKDIAKDIVVVKFNHQPVAQLYDEYEQFILSCMPGSDENKNGDKTSIVASLNDETVASNDGEEDLEALKISLERKLHEIEHNDSEDAIKIKNTVEPLQKEQLVVPNPIESESSSSSSSASSSESSSSSTSSRKQKLKKKNRTIKNQKANNTIKIEENIFTLQASIGDDELSDDELLSKVEQLKQQMLEKRKALDNKRRLVANDSENLSKPNISDALWCPEKRSAISLKIGTPKSNSVKVKPVTLDDDDFTDKLLLEVSSSSASKLARTQETNKLLIERVIEPEVGLVSSSNRNSLASEIINTKVTRIGMLPSNSIASDAFPSEKPVDIEISKIGPKQSFPVDTSEMKNYLNDATMSHYDSCDSVTSKASTSVDSSILNNSFPAVIHKISATKHQTTPPRSDKRDSSDTSSKSKQYHQSRTKDVSNKRHYSPLPHRNRSLRSRKRSSHRSPSRLRKRSRGSPRRSRSPRRYSPRRIRKSLSPRSKRTLSPMRGRPRTPPLPDKHTNRKWEPPHDEYKSSTLKCDDNIPQPIYRLDSSSTSWISELNSAFAEYDFQHIHPLSPKRSLDESIAHSFEHSDQSYDFHQGNNSYMDSFEYSTESTSKIPVLNSQENYYFQPQTNLRPQCLDLQGRPPQPTQHLPRQHVPSQHVTPQHVKHIIPNQLTPQSLPLHPPAQQWSFPNLIEIRQSNIADVGPTPTPFVVKGNVLEIVPKTEAIIDELQIDSSSIQNDSFCDLKLEMKIELTEAEMEQRELKKAELKLKRKHERDKKCLERFMRKEKLRLEIKHLMEAGVPISDTKKASYNPNAVGGKSILRLGSANSGKKSVVFADGVAPGDGTSTSGGEDVVPLLRDRNKRMTKRKLDSKRRRARREAAVIKKETAPQAVEITPFIDPELENMPPPLPPDGNPPARLHQPKLKSTPKLIYFHYDPRSNAMYVSPYTTTVHIPQKPSDKSGSAINKHSNDSPTASSTPDQIQKPKVCFIQPPVFDEHLTQLQGPNQSVLHSGQQPSPTLSNSGSSIDVPTSLLSLNPYSQKPSSLPTSPSLHPSRQQHPSPPQNYRASLHPISQQTMPIQSKTIQPPPLLSHWDNSGYQTNTPILSPQQQPCWDSDRYFPPTPSIRPNKRFGILNNATQQRQWEHQQRHAQPLFQITPQTPFNNMQSHPRPNHQVFHPNQSNNLNPTHQQHNSNNNFAFNSNYNFNSNSHQHWNQQYRNN